MDIIFVWGLKQAPAWEQNRMLKKTTLQRHTYKQKHNSNITTAPGTKAARAIC